MVIAFSPIDISLLDYDKEHLNEFFFKNCYTHSDHNGPKTSELDQIMSYWDYLIIRSSKMAEQEKTPTSWYKYEIVDDTWCWNEEFESEFPYLIDSVMQLPFDRLTYVGLFSNHRDIVLHKDRVHVRDENGKMVGHRTIDNPEYVSKAMEVYEQKIHLLEPCSYRFFLYGPKNNSFIVSPDNNEQNGIFVNMPDDTDCFVFNGTDIFHGAKTPPLPKILMYVSGFLNKEKHEELLARSIEKYKNYVVKFNE